MSRTWARATAVEFAPVGERLLARLALLIVVVLTGILLLEKPSRTAPSVATPGHKVDQQALQSCITQDDGNCERKVPNLAQCMAAREVCNEAAWEERQGQYPPLRGLQDENNLMSKEAAEGLARGPDAPPTAATFSRLMLLGDFEASHPEYGRSQVDPKRRVWVVTVQSPIWTPGNPDNAPELKSHYTVVMDAETRSLIVMCTGCATVT